MGNRVETARTEKCCWEPEVTDNIKRIEWRAPGTVILVLVTRISCRTVLVPIPVTSTGMTAEGLST